jgi:hypothetical protein
MRPRRCDLGFGGRCGRPSPASPAPGARRTTHPGRARSRRDRPDALSSAAAAAGRRVRLGAGGEERRDDVTITTAPVLPTETRRPGRFRTITRRRRRCGQSSVRTSIAWRIASPGRWKSTGTPVGSARGRPFSDINQPSVRVMPVDASTHGVSSLCVNSVSAPSRARIRAPASRRWVPALDAGVCSPPSRGRDPFDVVGRAGETRGVRMPRTSRNSASIARASV